MRLVFKFITAIGFLSVLVVLLASSQTDQIFIRKHVQKHDTYAKGEPNFDFCCQLCTSKGGVNCGGTRLGCCTVAGCTKNKIYGYNECATGASVQLGTTRCIGSWGN